MQRHHTGDRHRNAAGRQQDRLPIVHLAPRTRLLRTECDLRYHMLCLTTGAVAKKKNLMDGLGLGVVANGNKAGAACRLIRPRVKRASRHYGTRAPRYVACTENRFAPMERPQTRSGGEYLHANNLPGVGFHDEPAGIARTTEKPLRACRPCPHTPARITDPSGRRGIQALALAISASEKNSAVRQVETRAWRDGLKPEQRLSPTRG